MRPLVVLAALALVAPGAAAAQERLPVVVVPGLDLADLDELADRGAVGLLVPGAGPMTSEVLARAAVERGEARNSLRGGLPDAPRLIRLRTADAVPEGPVIVLSLPEGGRRRNDRRYAIAVLAPGYRGLLTSPSTRIAGLVSAVDVAPTALRDEDGLASQPAADPVERLRELDEQIADNGTARQPASIAAAVLVALLALVRPRAAVLGIGFAIAANLLVGVAGVSAPWLSVALVAGSVVVAGVLPALRPLALGLVCAGVVGAYLLAMGVDDRWVALSPLGPSQNARFFGISNLLETMLLVPALVGAAVLGRRFGVVGFVVVAAAALVAVAGSRFGADGGGAIVLAAGLAVLAVALAGGGRRAWLLGAGAAVLAVGVLALDAALGPATHVGESVGGGPAELAGDLGDRISLSYRRATSGVGSAVAVVAGIVALAALGWRSRDRALPLAFAAAIAVSLIVNDSPVDVTIWGLAGLLALAARPREDEVPQLESRAFLPLRS